MDFIAAILICILWVVAGVCVVYRLLLPSASFFHIGLETKNWSWLPTATVSCWAISIGGKVLLMLSGGTHSVTGMNIFGLFDFVGLAAILLTVALVIQRGARWLKQNKLEPFRGAAKDNRGNTNEEIAMAKTVLKVIATLYVVIGALHSIFFSFFISRSDCISPKGLVSVFCNTGTGISHFVIALGWPFYWL